jgi:hypothetical protein
MVAVMAASLIMNWWQNDSQKLIQTPATTATDDSSIYKVPKTLDFSAFLDTTLQIDHFGIPADFERNSLFN